MSHNGSRSIPTDLRFPVCSTAPASNTPPPRACVVMAHGFSGTMEWIVPDFAERFADGGFAVLIFDYRYLGSSQGEPRQLIDSRRQLDDLRRAVDFAWATHGIDANRIALWAHRSAEATLSTLPRTTLCLLWLSPMSRGSTCSGEPADVSASRLSTDQHAGRGGNDSVAGRGGAGRCARRSRIVAALDRRVRAARSRGLQ